RFDLAHNDVLHHPHSLRASHAGPSELVDHPRHLFASEHTSRRRAIVCRCGSHVGQFDLFRSSTSSSEAHTQKQIKTLWTEETNPQQLSVHAISSLSTSGSPSCGVRRALLNQ
ncbi:unnamed protein product, partial [Ectocarpus sp. 12 AP-2014]